MRNSVLAILVFFAAIAAGCARQPARPAPVAMPAEKAYVAPQSAPVLSPSYPSLAGDVVQIGTASIPLVQGR